MSSGPPLPPPLQTSAGSFFANSSMNTPLTPDYDDVESPSLTSGNALARFEFENPGARESKNGTKVLMVEWEDDDQTRDIRGDWTVGWEGKRAAVLSANGEDGSREGLHRLYFLLSAGERVPGTVSLTLQSSDNGQEKAVWRTHPLPAIFAPELGASARQAGKKGVLHTVWAKKRLQVLKQEIQQEERDNPEGVALSMALQERDWIESNFGVRTKPFGLDISAANKQGSTNLGLPSPASPRSPGRGPLLEKLKGLKVDISPDTAPAASHEQNPLSPEGSDVAVNFNSFAALSGLPDLSSLAAKPAQQPESQDSRVTPPPRRMAPQLPPQSILARQQSQYAGSNMASLNAFAATTTPVEFKDMPSSAELSTPNDAAADEDDLFALPLSPRSPSDQPKGTAFSFDMVDTEKYTQ